jgi:PAS domain S-box-containing protein
MWDLNVSLPRLRLGPLRDYALALALVGIAVVLEVSIDQYIGDARYITFLIPVIVTAVNGSLGAGLFCLAISFAAIHLFLFKPGFSLYNELVALPDVALFLLAGLSSVILIAGMRFSIERESLQEGRARLQLALDTAQLGWWQYDPRRLVASGDGRCKEIFGVSGDEIPIEEFEQRVHPDDAERFWADHREMLDPTGPQRFTHEYRVQPRDGEVRWVRVSWLTHREGDEHERRLVGVVGTVLDITEHKLAQRSREIDEKNQQLRQANAELMAVYDQGMFASHLDMEGRIVHANRACVEGLGFARADVIGKRFWEVSWWDTAECKEWLRNAFEQAAAGTQFRGELNYGLPDGTARVTDIAFVPIKDTAGRVISVFVPGTDITDRARQYRATFENAGVGIAHLSPDVKWLRVNRTFACIVGYSPEELVSKSVQDITHPDDLKSSLAEVERLRSGRVDSYEMEKRYVRKDGTPVWVHITGTAVRRNDGLVDHFVAVIQDISARKRAEELMRRQADLLEQSHEAIFTWKIGGGITYWNRGAEVLYGYSREEATGRCPHALLRTRAAVSLEMIERETTRRGSWAGELTHAMRDGRDILVESRIVGVSYDGEPFALETNRDISERKRAEDALRNSEERLRAIYDGTLQYIGLLSPDGTLLDANRASLEFAGDAFGSKREHVVGRPFWETVWFVHTPGAPEKLRECIARAGAGEFIRYEAPLMRPSGEQVIFDFSLHPVRNKQGDVVLIVPEGRIITDRKRAEEELVKSEERFRSSVVQSPVPTILYDDREQILAVSRSWLEAAGGIPAEKLRRIEDWTRMAYGERSDEIMELGRREILAAEPEARVDILTIRTCSGASRLWKFVSSCLGTKSDGRHLFISVAQDVTDQRAYEERIELLMREARHRTKNILSLVQAVARQTVLSDPEQFIDRFIDRVQAIAANQDLLVRTSWKAVDIDDLVRAQLAHFSDLIEHRISLRGPKLHLNGAAAQAIGMALHELSTNASKYGALSTDAGHVDIAWGADDDLFKINWIERDGPPVRPPGRRGFGTTVMESMAKQAVEGAVQLEYNTAGVAWRLTCPANNALESR